jgi:1-deoxy-D-xylulose-5-phosphate reductoisomerase
MEAGRIGGTMPAVMAAADEVAVQRFLDREVGFLDIPRIIERVMSEHEPVAAPDLEAVLAADAWARDAASRPLAGAAR